MPDHKQRLESILFNLQTNNITDNIIKNIYVTKIKPTVATKYQRKATCVRTRPRPLKDIHALTDWRVPNVPFDLFGKPKDIVRTNPYEVQKPYRSFFTSTVCDHARGSLEGNCSPGGAHEEGPRNGSETSAIVKEKPPDADRKLVQKTRPRLVITPAASLDDITDGPRKILIDSMYQTSAVSNTRGVFAETHNVVAPFPGLPAPAKPLQIPKLSPLYVSPEWRMDSVSWDSRQHRAYADPAKEFWLARIPNCEECKKTAAREAMKKLKPKL